MTSKITHYQLSQEADIDLDEIFEYTEKAHGFNQAVEYLNALEILFNTLVLNPEIGRKRPEIKRGLYSISEQSHSVFYRIMETCITIVRVLHGQKEIPKHFKK